MSADPRRFAQVVLTAFEAAGRTSDTLVTQAGGPSTTTMTKLRHAAEGIGELAEPRSPTWRKIERAANWPEGSARRVWDTGEPPAPTPGVPAGARQVGDPADDMVEFHVSGSFGVHAVVKGPVRDLDALQAAVSKLIAGMQIDESNTRTVP